MYRLISPDFLNPFWFNAVRGGVHECRAVSETAIELDNVILRVDPSEDIRLTEGETVFVYSGGSGEFFTLKQRKKRRGKTKNFEYGVKSLNTRQKG